MPKRATAIVLSEKEQEGLEQIIRRHRSEQQVVMRRLLVIWVLTWIRCVCGEIAGQASKGSIRRP